MPSEFEALEKVVGTIKNSGNIAKRILNWLESSQWEVPTEFGKNPFAKIKSITQLDEKYKELVEEYARKNLRSLLNVFYLQQLILILENITEALELLENEFEKLKQLKFRLKINDAVGYPNQTKDPYEGDPLNLTPEQIQKGEFPKDPRIKDPGKPKDPDQSEEDNSSEEASQSDIKAAKEIEKELNDELITLLRAVGKYNVYRFDEIFRTDKIKFINQLKGYYFESLKTLRKKLELYKEEVKTGKQKKKVKKETDTYLEPNLKNSNKKIKIKIKK
jgi:hypothetical protein